jgi:hypothetical protein
MFSDYPFSKPVQKFTRDTDLRARLDEMPRCAEKMEKEWE